MMLILIRTEQSKLIKNNIPFFHSSLQFRQQKISVELMNSLNVGEDIIEDLLWQNSFSTTFVINLQVKHLYVTENK